MTQDSRMKFDFLIEAITDTREWINFMDAKAGALALFTTTISLVLTDKLIQNYSEISKVLNGINKGSILEVVFIILLSTLPVINILFILWVLFPRSNPKKKVKLYDKKILNLFYQSKFDKNRMAITLEDYLNTLDSSDYSSIISELSYHFLKLSYIRTKKEVLMRITQWLVFLHMTILIFVYTWVAISLSIL